MSECHAGVGNKRTPTPGNWWVRNVELTPKNASRHDFESMAGTVNSQIRATSRKRSERSGNSVPQFQSPASRRKRVARLLQEGGDFCFLAEIALFAESLPVEQGRMMTVALVAPLGPVLDAGDDSRRTSRHGYAMRRVASQTIRSCSTARDGSNRSR